MKSGNLSDAQSAFAKLQTDRKVQKGHQSHGGGKAAASGGTTTATSAASSAASTASQILSNQSTTNSTSVSGNGSIDSSA